MKEQVYDPEATYTCRRCKEPLPAGKITSANFEWHQAHGTDCPDCHEERMETLTKEQKVVRAKANGYR